MVASEAPRVALFVVALVLTGCGTIASEQPHVDGGTVMDPPATRDATAGRDGGERVDGGRDARVGCDSGEPGIRCLAAASQTSLFGSAIAVDDASVYWAASGDEPGTSILRVARSGGVITTLASHGNPEAVLSLLSDGVSLYWGAGGSGLQTVPVGGGLVVTLAPSGSLWCITQDEGYIYWTDQGHSGAHDGYIGKVGKNGGTITTLVPDQGALAITVDDASVYWMDGAGVMTVGKDGGTPATVLAPVTMDGYYYGCRFSRRGRAEGGRAREHR